LQLIPGVLQAELAKDTTLRKRRKAHLSVAAPLPHKSRDLCGVFCKQSLQKMNEFTISSSCHLCFFTQKRGDSIRKFVGNPGLFKNQIAQP
jgi:hypothetical protein